MPESGNIMNLLEAGIRAEELRQRTIASNIANIETPGYRRLDVRFEQSLAKALNSPGGVDADALEAGGLSAERSAARSPTATT